MVKIRLIFLALLISTITQAQNQGWCASDEVMQELYALDPQLEADLQALILGAQSRNVDNTTVYTIPVVFHILHEYGPENVSDAQCFSQIDALNKDFRKLNADTVSIVPAFQALAADSRIEFKLAGKDPYGQCTNGIIRYNDHNTNSGDDFIKSTQWPRSRYLNVWVVKTMARPGVAGYAYLPNGVGSAGFWLDGIVIWNTYFGSTGTSNPGRSHTLSHEVGHYLSLQHPWGSGEVGTTCGDDGIPDTPITKGWQTCNLTSNDVCNPGIQENVQNIMEYAYCDRMFTHGQANQMRDVLTASVSERDNLITAANHALVGIDQATPPLCVPLPDFSMNRNFVCIGDAVNFSNNVMRGAASSYLWTFQDGNPATSTGANPSVTFTSHGWKSVSLTATNAAGSETYTLERAVFVSPNWAVIQPPHTETFETETAMWWKVDNPGRVNHEWQLTGAAGFNSSQSMALRYFRQTIPNPPPYHPDFFYYRQLGSARDAIVSPTYDMRYMSQASLSFKYACATIASTNAQLAEVLRIYTSVDCGKTWSLRKSITKAELANNGGMFADFVPNNPNQWATATVSLQPVQGQSRVMFKIEYTASDFSNNIYIDNVSVEGVLSVDYPGEEAGYIEVYPNPASDVLHVSLLQGTGKEQVELYNMNGQRVWIGHAENGSSLLTIDMQPFANGLYLVRVTGENYMVTKKIVK
jgi:PKD repeat protein